MTAPVAQDARENNRDELFQRYDYLCVNAARRRAGIFDPANMPDSKDCVGKISGAVCPALIECGNQRVYVSCSMHELPIDLTAGAWIYAY